MAIAVEYGNLLAVIESVVSQAVDNLLLAFSYSADSGTIQSVSGFLGSDPIKALDPVFKGPDNQFNTSYPYVDNGGISFDTASGGHFNLSFNGSQLVITGGGGSDPALQNYVITNVTVTAGFQAPPPFAVPDLTHAVFGQQDVVAPGVIRSFNASSGVLIVCATAPDGTVRFKPAPTALAIPQATDVRSS
jgi:hypothetical protein